MSRPNSGELRVQLVCGDRALEAQVRAELEGIARVEALAPRAVALPSSDHRQLWLVDVGDAAGRGFAALQRLKRQAPPGPLVAIGSSRDPDRMIAAMHAGADEFALPGEIGELVRRVIEREHRRDEERGQILTMLPVKGGVGATTIAINLAGELAAIGRRVLLVDLDPRPTGALTLLGLPRRLSVAELAARPRRPTREQLLASLSRHASGLAVLAESPEHAAAEPDRLGPLLALLGAEFDEVICDGIHPFDAISRAALAAAGRVLVVSQADEPTLRCGEQCMARFRALGCAPAMLIAVFNRRTPADPEARALARRLGCDSFAEVANDYPAVTKASRDGWLLSASAPSALVTADIRRLAKQVAGAPSRRPGEATARGSSHAWSPR